MIAQTIFGKLPADQGFQFWIPVTQRAIWIESVEDAAEYAESYDDEEVLVSLGTWQTNPAVETFTAKMSAGELRSVPGFAARFVKRSESGFVHPTPTDAINLGVDLGEPTVLINTGDGLEFLWLFDEPVRFRSVEQISAYAAQYHAFIEKISAPARINGWQIVNAEEMPTWVHVPGTVNHSTNGPPEDVVLMYEHGKRHAVANLVGEDLVTPANGNAETLRERFPEPESNDPLDKQLEIINDALGTTIRRVVMYKGNAPDFDFHIWDPYDDCERVLAFKTREVMKLTFFRERMAPYMKTQIDHRPPSEWERMAQSIFECAERLDMGDQESSTQRFQSLCRTYISGNPATNSQPTKIEEHEPIPPFAPPEFPSHVIIHIPSLSTWLNASRPNHGFSEREMYRACHAIGGEQFSTSPTAAGGIRYRAWKLPRAAIGMK